MKYIILAETGADIPQDLLDEYGIYTVPMHVEFEGETRADGTFPVTELFQSYKKTGVLPKTSGCNVTDFEQIFDRIHTEHPESHILYLAYSACTTCSYQSAVIAGENLDYITYFDTKMVSAGQCMSVIALARYVKAHPDAEISEIMEKAEEIREKSRMGFFPGDLDYLRAGGRVSNAAYLGARILSLNPLIEMQDGKLMASKKYRGNMSKVSEKLLKEFVEKHDFSRDLLFFVYSLGFSEAQMEKLTAEAREMGFQEIRWIRTGCVISTHSGPGAFGICGFSR